MLADTGEVLDDVTSVVHSPEGLRQLVNLPAGSAEAELSLLLLQVQLYRYLETTRNWNVLGADIMKSSADLKEKIRQGKKIGGGAAPPSVEGGHLCHYTARRSVGVARGRGLSGRWCNLLTSNCDQ